MATVAQMKTIVLGGTWYEVEVTQCYTYLLLRDAVGTEHKFFYDGEGLAEMHAKLGQ